MKQLILCCDTLMHIFFNGIYSLPSTACVHFLAFLRIRWKSGGTRATQHITQNRTQAIRASRARTQGAARRRADVAHEQQVVAALVGEVAEGRGGRDRGHKRYPRRRGRGRGAMGTNGLGKIRSKPIAYFFPRRCVPDHDPRITGCGKVGSRSNLVSWRFLKERCFFLQGNANRSRGKT